MALGEGARYPGSCCALSAAPHPGARYPKSPKLYVVVTLVCCGDPSGGFGRETMPSCLPSRSLSETFEKCWRPAQPRYGNFQPDLLNAAPGVVAASRARACPTELMLDLSPTGVQSSLGALGEGLQVGKKIEIRDGRTVHFVG